MEWTDEGIVLTVRRHGESSAIVSLFTRGHGRHLGLVRGGAGARARGIYQPGNRVAARWRARLADHLGTYTCELTHGGAALLLDEPLPLAALAAACAVADAALPEREPHERLWERFSALVEALEAGDGWPTLYVVFEIELLKDIGFGLDLSASAVTDEPSELAFVSPKSGRAVSARATRPGEGRLFPLPSFLRGGGMGRAPPLPASPAEILDGLEIAGHFLAERVFHPHDRHVPFARARFVDRFRKSATISGRM